MLRGRRKPRAAARSLGRSRGHRLPSGIGLHGGPSRRDRGDAHRERPALPELEARHGRHRSLYSPSRHAARRGAAQEPIELTLRATALVRLLLPDAHMPATTAAGSLDPEGREKMILAGANVLMPNITPPAAKRNYLLYPGKICLDEEGETCIGCLSLRMRSIGRELSFRRGDAPRLGVRRRTASRRRAPMPERRRYWGPETEKALRNFGRGLTPRSIIAAYAQVKLAALSAVQETEVALRSRALRLHRGRLARDRVGRPRRVLPPAPQAGRSGNEPQHEPERGRRRQGGGALSSSAAAGALRVDPFEDMNRCQSTNDTFPSAVTIVAYEAASRAEALVARLQDALAARERELETLLVAGRTELQDALPIRLGTGLRGLGRGASSGTAGGSPSCARG